MKILCNQTKALSAICGLVSEERNLILISGPTCSGKSFLSNRLLNRFSSSALLGGDAYFRDIHDPFLPTDGKSGYLYDVPGAYRSDKLRQDVSILLSGKDILLPDYNIRKNKLMSDCGPRVESGFPVIIDFLFAIKLLSDIQKNTIKVYLDIDKNVCLERRVKRDTESYGIEEWRVRKVFEEKFWPSFMLFAEEQKNQADIIVKTT